uniref:MKRN2 opposite strand n=1 Tax=Suricata suricatta TaxID=37032 RepID=A0A673TC08_SURSU
MPPAEAGKPLIKFNHCKKSIYSFSVPQCCPLCQQVMGSRKLEEAPVSISNPFTNGHQEQCSFLLRPTQGTFLRYEEDHHNCYSYTLTFINCVLTTEGKGHLDKGEFTEKYVVPRTRKASKYITLYRAIEERGFYVADCPEEEANPPKGSGGC